MNNWHSYIDQNGYICAECKETKRKLRLIEVEDLQKIKIVRIDLGIVGAHYYSEVNTLSRDQIAAALQWLIKESQ